MSKKNIYLLSYFMILFMFLMANCSKDEKKQTDVPEDPVITYNIAGKVVDNNRVSVPDARVTCTKNNTKFETTTSADGAYIFANMGLGDYTIDATKSGYTYGRTVARITEDGITVENIIIKSLATIENRVEQVSTAAEVKTNGVTVVTEVESHVSTGGNVTETNTQRVSATVQPDTEIRIDNQVVTGSITLAAAPIKVNDVPPPDTAAELSMGAVVFEPQNATFSKPVEVSIPVSIQLPPNLEIPVKKFENGQWREVGTAKINESGLGADASVTEFGQLSVQPQVELSVQSSQPTEQVQNQREVSADQDRVEATVETTVEFPGGLPAGITSEYATALIEKMKGVTLGTSSVMLNIPRLSQKIAKPASPLSPESAEVWVQRVTLVEKIIEVTDTITLNIIVSGTTINFTITYRYLRRITEVKVEKIWVDHNQGTVL